MNILKELLSAYGGDSLANSFFLLEFALIAFFSFSAVLRSISLELESRKRFNDRAAFIEGLFRVYSDQKAKLIEEEKRKEEETKARLA